MLSLRAAATNMMKCWRLRKLGLAVGGLRPSRAICKDRVSENSIDIMDPPCEKRTGVSRDIETSGGPEVSGAVHFLIIEPVSLLNIAVTVAIILG